jgi:hypothetical protein
MTVPQVKPQADIMEQVIIKGDLAKLTPDERVQYYNAVCKSIGLNPLTKPFEFITLNSKLQLYALRTATDQLRKINGVSLEIVSRDVTDDILTIHVRAKLPDGRIDEDLGAVSYPQTLRGEARANAELKCITKAKRRATLSICGLGWLDETEIADIPASAKRPAPPQPNVMISPHDPETGEVLIEHPNMTATEIRERERSSLPPTHGGEPAAAPESHVSGAAAFPGSDGGETATAGIETPADKPVAAASIEDEAREAARRGYDVLNALWKRLPTGGPERARLRKIEPELLALAKLRPTGDGGYTSA